MAFTIEAEIDVKVIRDFRVQVDRFPRLIQPVFRRTTRRRAVRVLEELRHTPGRPTYPLRWKSERQRRAFFATNGFGHGIPYRRSGNLSAGWAIDFDFERNGGRVVATNDVPYTRFVQGNDQQPFHSDTGWVRAPDVLSDFTVTIGDALVDNFFELFGAKRR